MEWKLLVKKAEQIDFTLPDREGKKLIRALGSSNLAQQQWASNAISYVCRENKQNREKLGKAIPRLVELLRSPEEKIQLWAVCAIGNLSLENARNQRKVVEMGGMEIVIGLLLSPSVEVKRWAANAIGIICMDHGGNGELFAMAGGIKALALGLSSEDKELQRWSVFAVASVCSYHPNRNQILESKPMFPLLAIISNFKDPEAQSWAVYVVGILSDHDDQFKNQFRIEGGMTKLKQIFESRPDPAIMRNLTFTFATITFENAENKQCARDIGMQDILIETAKRYPKDEIAHWCNISLTNIVTNQTAPDPIVAKSIRNKRLDLQDESKTVAMRLSKNPPSLNGVFDNKETKDDKETKTEKLAVSEISMESPSSVRSKSEHANNIPWDELKIEDNELLGTGAFGNVWKGEWKGKKVAVKEMLLVEDEKMEILIEREVSILRDVDHPNIIEWIGVCNDANGFFLITSLVEGCDLHAWLKTTENISWEHLINIARDISDAMSYLHQMNFLHRDMKCKNILIEKETGVAKMCDFGFARKEERTMTVKVGTDEFMAPEVMLGQPYDVKADVFSFGVVLYQMTIKKKPPKREAKNSFGFNLDQLRAEIESKSPPQKWTSIMLDCLSLKPNMRPMFYYLKTQFTQLKST
eukprot:TRINITY_DN1972_c0_g1_i1.p1 TRINITY_DN1972_c0_g1~~TRINITY_DN1972_c0_g1_i1.p1  ORF type:complete len:658 (-),score=168.73 TRINITY_DN1972_c0_g1_i1:9-1931(-)